MSDELFDIFFSGKVLDPGQTEQAKQKIAKLFNADDALIARLFSGKPVKIKKAVDMDTAIRYRVKFREIGAVVDIRPAKAAAETGKADIPAPPVPETVAEPASPPAPSPLASSQAASPPVQPPAGEEDNSLVDASLAIPGSMIDDAVPAPPANIDTSHLSAAGANVGSLEDYAEIVAAPPLPDISDLEIDTSAGPLDNRPAAPPLEVDTGNMAIDAFSGNLDDRAPPPPANIDTSNLTASDANTGSLEAFNTRPEPQPIPDTSKLDLA